MSSWRIAGTAPHRNAGRSDGEPIPARRQYRELHHQREQSRCRLPLGLSADVAARHIRRDRRELRFGAARLPHAKRLHAVIEAFFSRVTILPWDSDAARHYGQLRATLEREGQPEGNLDILIGAHALALS